MGTVHIIMLVVAVVALIGIILSILDLAGFSPKGRPICAEDYDNPALKAFLICAIVLLLDGAAWFGCLLWCLSELAA